MGHKRQESRWNNCVKHHTDTIWRALYVLITHEIILSITRRCRNSIVRVIFMLLSQVHQVVEQNYVARECTNPTPNAGVGKTTLVKRVTECLKREHALHLRGFYTEEVRQSEGRGKGTRVGFDVVTLNGNRGPLARIGRSARLTYQLALIRIYCVLSIFSRTSYQHRCTRRLGCTTQTCLCWQIPSRCGFIRENSASSHAYRPRSPRGAPRCRGRGGENGTLKQWLCRGCEGAVWQQPVRRAGNNSNSQCQIPLVGWGVKKTGRLSVVWGN